MASSAALRNASPVACLDLVEAASCNEDNLDVASSTALSVVVVESFLESSLAVVVVDSAFETGLPVPVVRSITFPCLSVMVNAFFSRGAEAIVARPNDDVGGGCCCCCIGIRRGSLYFIASSGNIMLSTSMFAY
jgi:hypothetical protein